MALRGGRQADPDLNAALARVLAKHLRAGTVSDQIARVAQLKSAVKAGAEDGNIKAQLKARLESKDLSTGDVAVDSELATLLN